MFDKIVDLFFRVARFLQFFAIIRVYQGGVILRLGKFNRLAHIGWNWMWPLSVEEIYTANLVTETMLVGPQSLATKDGREVVVSTVVTFRVEDPKVFLLEIEGANRVIEDSAFGEIAAWVMEQTWAELQTVDINKKLTSCLRRRAAKFGVSIDRVQIVDLTKSRSIRLLQSVTSQNVATKEF